ncbi:MAG: anthranilate synthase component I family protein [Pirellulaceae bacterium]|nr:anthranilate synthase component I family protein [Pirellulaceae bacterium]
MSTVASQFDPFVRALPSSWSPEHCFRRLSRLPGCVWLDSSQSLTNLGRYSYLAADPLVTLRIDKPYAEALDSVARFCQQYYQPAVAELPPFQGGWMGWFGYELGACFEKLPSFRYNEFQLPLAALGLYDVVLAWDHARGQSWVVSQGWPKVGRAREIQAYRRLQQLLAHLESDAPSKDPRPLTATGTWPLAANRLAPQYPTRWSSNWTSNFSSSGYRQAVTRAVEYVHAGDIFQVNLAQRLLHKARCSAADLALHLRTTNPAPFAGYADFGRVQVVSTSPERFLKLQNGQIEVRPIKGTRPRMSDPVADQGIAQLLRNSPKDRSENVMIVDLLRNDLSRIADQDSVRVSQLCELEGYRYVWHLVSAIEAKLSSGRTPIDILKATFPGGSITGAPKIRAMEIIAELEPTCRGPYCGSLGYISFAGDMDLNILIRTITACEGWWQLPVGGGIVADSQPEMEEQETWHKADGILRAIDQLVV